MCLFVPSKSLKNRIRKKLITKSKIDGLRDSVDMLYFILENCVGVSNIPHAVGELGTIQEANLKLIKYFDELCSRHNLQYWLDFGTLLGAVRHKGFIPWDDDLDVGMPRDDYRRLLDILKNEMRTSADNNKCCKSETLEKKLTSDELSSLVYDDYVANYCGIGGRCKSESDDYLFEIKKEKPTKQLLKIFSKDGFAQLDVFPYDFYYKKIETEEDKTVFYKNLNVGYDKYRNEFGLKIVKGEIDYSCFDIEILTGKTVLQNNTVDLKKMPSMFWGIEFYHGWLNKIIDFKTIFPIKELEFEGLKFSVPNNYDKHLRSIYGDYMKIPRETHIHEKIFKK